MVLRNPSVTADEVATFVKFPQYSVNAMRYVFSNAEWMANRQVMFNLVLNPKCPREIQLSILRRMKVNELQALQRSGKLNIATAKMVKDLILKEREQHSAESMKRWRGRKKKR